MHGINKIAIVIVLILVIFVFLGFGFNNFTNKISTNNVSAHSQEDSFDSLDIQDYFSQPDTNWGVYKEKVKVKGIYLTGNTVAYEERFNKLVELVKETELNAMVIDVKDDLGLLTYDSNVDMVDELGADKHAKVKNFMEKMEVLRQNNIYPIARIVTFKDRLASSKRPDLAIKSKTGDVWRDNKGDSWLNPYNKESWEYPIKIAEEAALMGFKEIQFDYIRFPTDGNRSLIDYGPIAKEKSMAEAIAEFLKYARERLEPKGVYVSADIFGLVTTVTDDMRIGQHLETLAESVDILCPMVYPSHYALGTYGVAYPDTNPYKIVNTSLNTAVERIKNIDSNGEKAMIRPWLQDFSAPWLKKAYGEHYITYGPEQIRAQIKATYDAGLEEWLFWNAGNKYTESAFLRENNANN